MELLHTARPQNSLLAGLMSSYAEARVDLFRRRVFARTVRTLESLTDRQLSDIGIGRDQIHQKAYDSVYNQKPYQS